MESQERIRINKLIRKISKNNVKALDKLFEITKYQFYALAKQYVKYSTIADEVLSDGYLQIYKKSRSFNHKTMDGYDWMCEIISYVALEYSKRNSELNKETTRS